MRSAILVLLIFFLRKCIAQDANNSDLCYGPGSIAASVLVTLIVTCLLFVLFVLVWKNYWKNRREKHLILETDPEKGTNSPYAFDNVGFKDNSAAPTPLNSTLEKNHRLTDSNKTKWSQWSPLGALISSKTEKQRALDDTTSRTEQIKTVLLKSHDFTGLGFNIYGNMRDGIFIRDILNRGPASESGLLNSGDRIKSVTINFEHIVYEDALTILSYASPYEVTLEAKNGKITSNQAPVGCMLGKLVHPVYRSSSSADLSEITSAAKKCLFPDVTLERKSPKLQLDPTANHDPPKQQTPHEPTYQKLGVKVLPVGPVSPKTAEQNDNNINLEKLTVSSTEEPEFTRENSGIKRDKNGIPQEIPSHMLEAATFAKRNRRSAAASSPKKQKGRAPAPPLQEKFNSDSENESSVIELNPADVTVHHVDDVSRRTASTGDLTKIEVRSGTLGRAQSLDITDGFDSGAESNEVEDGGVNAAFQRLKKCTEWGNLEDAINMNDKIQAENQIDEKQETNSEPDNESLNLLPRHILASENFLLNERDCSNEDLFYTLNNASDDIKVSLNLEKPDDSASNVENHELYLTALDTTAIETEEEEDRTLVSNAVLNLTPTYVTEIHVATTPPDPDTELDKIHAIAEQQLKLLPELRFEKPPPPPTPIRSKTPERSSRIPVATNGKTPPTSPERRDSRVFAEVDKEIVALMSSTPSNGKATSRNVSVTSIRSGSKIPSGFVGRPPAVPRKFEESETNGSSPFKQWVFRADN